MEAIEIFSPITLEIEEVFIYYDRPLLFTCKDEVGQKYLVMLVEENEEDETWMYIAMSEYRLNYVRAGDIDLLTAIKRAERRFVYMVHVTNGGADYETKVVPVEALIEDWLPKPGKFIKAQTKVISSPKREKAIQSLREQLDLRLNFAKAKRFEAPAAALGSILTCFQAAIDQIGLAINNGRVLVNVTGTAEGSFRVLLETNEQVNLFGESKVQTAVHEFMRLMNTNEQDDEKLLEILNSFGSNASEKYLDFLKSLFQNDANFAELTWTSPNPQLGGKAIIEKEKISDLIRIIETSGIKEVKEFEVIGHLRGIYLDNHKICIQSQNGEKFWGTISPELMNSDLVQTAQVNKEYKVIFRETTEINSTINNKKVNEAIIYIEAIN